MKTFLTISIFCLTLAYGFSQTLDLKKASPFTAVTWTDDDQPKVQVDNEWYILKKLDGHTAEKIITFCKKEYGTKWKKRFSEDLIEVLQAMGTPPQKHVDLVLLKDHQLITKTGTYSFENRQKLYDFNQQITKKVKYISTSEALADIEQFETIIEEQSSYIHLSGFDYEASLSSLKLEIQQSTDSLDINYLTHELAMIMAKIGDRHSSVKNEWVTQEGHPSYSLELPFTIAPLNGKVAALTSSNHEHHYAFLHPKYPYIKSINNVPIHNLIDSLAYKSRTAPKEAKLSRGVSSLQQLGKLYFNNNLDIPENINITFTNGKIDSAANISLTKERSGYRSKIDQQMYYNSLEVDKGNFQNLARILPGNIGYFSFPRMYSFDEEKGLEAFLDSTFINFKSSKALVIDLRFNPGGSRDLIQKFASHIIPKAQSPWVANIAYLRTNQRQADYPSMHARFLYPYISKPFNSADRKAIDHFLKDFDPEREFDTSKFSTAHFMILHAGDKPYPKNIYILVNEHSFSAASVFTSVFKGLPNVNIVGVTTDGSSGNSRKMYLKNSNIRVKISTMLSFQRNGTTLDGHGTAPDIYISEDETQVLTGIDTQLQKLLEIINHQ
ncbi:S41 family peptidase [Fulvivirga maritima]|uniref:S41 family peptidase n=1 Tax=Fulvivirga maritima TaxID=2904247 RepID=UPI001F188B32|nr:S41 family peptidase [Fulvivirga maritima]UII26364.1 S41 family peptidase [Fulvivirga maritima]